MSEQLVDKKVKMQMVGMDGNIFMVLGQWQRHAKRQEWTEEEITKVRSAVMQGGSGYDGALGLIIEHTEETDEEEVKEYETKLREAREQKRARA